MENQAESRISICNKCPLNVKGTCVPYRKIQVVKDFNYKGEDRKKGQLVTGCGCVLISKVRSPQSQCPANKW